MSMIFSDIDGTLYGFDHKIHPDLKKHIKEAKNASIMFNIATGNGLFEGVIKLGEELGAKYIITSNGATIYDVVEKKIIFENKISDSVANEMLEEANALNVSADWWDDEGIYYNKFILEEVKKACVQAAGLNKKNLKEINKITNPIYKIEFVDKDPKKIGKLLKVIEKHKVQVARINDFHIEITKPRVSKATGVKHICKLHNENYKKVMVIGDSANDIPMMELTEYSYAMANASNEVKQVAKLNAAAYNQNGVGLSIIDYIHRVKKD